MSATAIPTGGLAVHRPALTRTASALLTLTKRRAALNANGIICRIHVDGTHSGEVYDDAIIAKCAATHIVTATTNRGQQIIRASKVDSGNDVSYA